MKRLLSAILCLVMLLSLCACGKKEEASVGTSARPKLEISGNTAAVSAASECTISEYLSSGERIWYYIDENLKGKDTKVSRIIIFEPDGTAYHAWNKGYTLGELEQMDDSDIVSFVKDAYAEQVVINGYEEYFQNDDTSIIISRIQNGAFEAIASHVYHEGSDLDLETYLQYFEDSSEFKLYHKAIEAEWENIRDLYNTYFTYATSIEMPDMAYYVFSGFAFADETETNERLENWTSNYATSEADIAATKEFGAYLRSTGIGEKVYNRFLQLVEEYEATIQPSQYKFGLKSDSTGNKTAAEHIAIMTPYPQAGVEGTPVYRHSLEYELTNAITVYDSTYDGYYHSNDGYFLTRVANDTTFKLDQIGESDFPVDVHHRTLFGLEDGE